VPVTPGGATHAGTSPTPDPTATPAPSGPTLPELPVADPWSVSVGSTEFAFTLSQPSVAAGDVRIQFDNRRGEDPHDLVLRRAGTVVAHFGVLAAGVLTFRTIALRAGSYDLLCPLEGHVAAGMSATLTVRSGP
jgi:plastocyanin